MKLEALIVDDDPIFVMIAKRIIVSTGFHTSPLTFANGELALEYLLKESDPETHYAIFLDINMPIMNGWEFLDAIHLNSIESKTHVFMITSSCSSVDKAKSAQYPNVLKYFEKPISRQDILELKQMDFLKQGI